MAQNDVILLDSILEKSKLRYQSTADTSEMFELFSFDHVLRDLDLSGDELDEAWTDGPNDGGIDGFFIVVDGRVATDDFLEQASRRAPVLSLHLFTCRRAESFEQAPLNSLLASVSELFDLRRSDAELSYPFNEHVLERRAFFKEVFTSLADRRPTLEVNVYYCSRGDTATLADNLTSRAIQIENLLNSQFSDAQVAFRFFGAAELLHAARQQRVYSLRLRFIESYISREGANYVILASLPSYFDFVKDEQGRLRRYLFDSNVRDFLGFKKRVFRESSGWFWGIIAGERPAGIGFRGLGASLEFGMMRDGQIMQATAASVGWIFVRGFPCARDRARCVR